MIQSEKSCSSTACYREQLAREWASSGIKHGDVVILHSSLSRTLKHYAGAASKITPKDILESFLQAVGPNGTIVFPTFNFDFTFGAPFDRGSTPSHMGILGEMARQDVRSYRTAHPVYSFAVIGADQEKFREKKNISAWGEDSPFATVHELDGKIAILDVPDCHSMTYLHYIEETCRVPFRYHKFFHGEYTESDCQSEKREYSIFVRDIEVGVVPCLDRMGEKLWEEGVYQGRRPGEGNGLRVGSAVKIFDFVKSVIESGQAQGLLYLIDHDTVVAHRAKWKERTNTINQDLDSK